MPPSDAVGAPGLRPRQCGSLDQAGTRPYKTPGRLGTIISTARHGDTDSVSVGSGLESAAIGGVFRGPEPLWREEGTSIRGNKFVLHYRVRAAPR